MKKRVMYISSDFLDYLPTSGEAYFTCLDCRDGFKKKKRKLHYLGSIRPLDISQRTSCYVCKKKICEYYLFENLGKIKPPKKQVGKKRNEILNPTAF